MAAVGGGCGRVTSLLSAGMEPGRRASPFSLSSACQTIWEAWECYLFREHSLTGVGSHGRMYYSLCDESALGRAATLAAASLGKIGHPRANFEFTVRGNGGCGGAVARTVSAGGFQRAGGPAYRSAG